MTELRHHDLQDLAERVDAGGRLLIAADFDGTLAPIVSNPAEARMLDSTAETLRRLAESRRVTVAILSGRRLADLTSRVGVPAILSGNHGLEISGQGLQFLHPVAAERAPLIADAVSLVTEILEAWPGSWVEDKGLTATVHFRHVERNRHCKVAFSVRSALAPFGTSLGMRAGKCSLEIHPRVGWHKGDAVQYIRRELRMENDPVLCLGDDATDETMFRVLKDSNTTVSVGHGRRTCADFQVSDAHAVSYLLSNLYEVLVGTPEAHLQISA